MNLEYYTSKFIAFIFNFVYVKNFKELIPYINELKKNMYKNIK